VCTPIPDPNTLSNNVIATTTALAYPRDTPNLADVCIVRLLISQYMPIDVNLDLVVNDTDINLVEDSQYYTFNLTAPSRCPQNSDLQYICGRVDVNFDGFVNQLDTTAITQSATLGTRLPCGGVYSTAFSCGSTRRAPLTPAVDISFDSIVYFNNDGLIGATTPQPLAKRRATLERGVMETILVDFEHMHNELLSLRNVVDYKVAAVDRRVDAKVAAVKHDVAVMDDKMFAVKSEVMSEVHAVESKVTSRVGSVAARVERHDRALSSGPSSPRELFAAISVTIGAIALCGAVVYAIARR
jgi:hypothetical protein